MTSNPLSQYFNSFLTVGELRIDRPIFYTNIRTIKKVIEAVNL